MDSPTFHCFMDLPLELRLQIWETCLHPFEPSAQFFTIANADRDICAKNLYVTSNMKYNLAAPPCQKTGERSWSRNNLSAYMIDHGLWTACHESRGVILKHHKNRRQAQFKALRASDYTVDMPPTLPTTLTGRFIEGDNERYFSFNPTDDLLSFDLVSFRCSIPFTDVMLGFNAKHIALEYRSIGIDDDLEPVVPLEYIDWLDLTHLLLPFMPSCPKLWFIDYGIGLMPGESYPTEDRAVFKGFGCSLVEMRDSDTCWVVTVPFWPYDKRFPNNVHYRFSYLEVFQFIDCLKEQANLFEGGMKSQWGVEDMHIAVGALACIRT
ncbi:hypothetical protein GGR57DRAFT_463410 [Xylariaceae sp. FL1272]|nr:hypothetical protein GGR57DRAFT_463410 [Xylariaceae sp. FL1272]